MTAIDPEDGVLVARMARVAYKSYGDRAGWKTYLDMPMPPWAELDDKVRGRWLASAKGVLAALVAAQPASTCQCGHAEYFHDVAEADGSDRRCCVCGFGD